MVKLAPGEVIFREGDQTYEMYIILAGSVEIYLDRGGKPLTLSILRQGDFFGEMAVLEELPRSGTARAVEESILVAINRNSFQKVIQDDPNLSWRIMKGLSARIRSLNRELALLSQGQLLDQEEEESEGGLAGAHTAYSGADRFDEAGFEDEGSPLNKVIEDERYSVILFDKVIKCPVCKEPFNAKMVRSSKIARTGTDTDFRIRCQDFEPLYYSVWVCPYCYYANYRSEFEAINEIQKKTLYNAGENRRKHFKPGFSPQRTVKQIIECYRLVLDCADSIKERAEKIGSVWLNLSWLYDDVGDEDRRREALEKALQFFEKGYMEGTNLSPERVQKLSYLIGEVYRKLGDYSKAREYYYRSIVRRGGNQGINTLAEDQLQSVKELIAKQEADKE